MIVYLVEQVQDICSCSLVFENTYRATLCPPFTMRYKVSAYSSLPVELQPPVIFEYTLHTGYDVHLNGHSLPFWEGLSSIGWSSTVPTPV